MSKSHPIKKLPSVKYLHECFTYNRRTGELRWKVRPRNHFDSFGKWTRWNGRFAGKIAGTITAFKYFTVGIDRKIYRVHRVIYKMMTGKEPSEIIDHKDGNPGDNRWGQLRPANGTQHRQNSSFRGGVSGHRYVYANGKNWKVRIRIRGKKQSFGNFPTIEEAARVAQAVARKVHGEFYRED